MSCRAAQGRAAERGATLSEYALVVALVVVGTIGSLVLLQDESGSYLADTGSDIGQPRALAADIDPDLPTPPPWLTQPPPPTTTTTTTAPPGPHPAGSVVLAGPMSDLGSAECYRVENPGVVGSPVDREPCSGGPEQIVEVVGDLGIVALRFTDAVNAGLCIAIDPADPTRTLMATCDGTPAQQFNLIDNGGSHTFESLENGRCLKGGGKLRARNCNGDPDRNFTF